MKTDIELVDFWRQMASDKEYPDDGNAHATIGVIRALIREVDKWRPLTPEEAQRAYEEAEVVPMSEEEIQRIFTAVLDPAHTPTNNDTAHMAHKFRQIREALVKLWKHTPKIDNGRCMVCRIGYASFEPDGKGGMKAGKCDREDCLSHVITKALAEN